MLMNVILDVLAALVLMLLLGRCIWCQLSPEWFEDESDDV